MNVHLVQINSVWEDRSANQVKARQLIASASPQPGSLIILPETFSTGFSMNLAVTAEPTNGPTEQFLREMAAHYQSCVIGGLVTSTENGRGMTIYKTLAAISSIMASFIKLYRGITFYC
ncbi:MAG: hypothetical protein B7Z21_00175 [Verrucomicrobiales bacterium 32-60-5]|nr:MAG: hypothetical protein B7Z21_00175 [Verrucomicrobiales bacterium 32-60-5]